MQNIISLLFGLLLIGSFVEAKEIKVSVKGMVCGFCANGIQKKFKAEPAVASVNVSLEKKLVTIETIKDQELPDSKIEAIIRDSGYNVDKIERK